MSNIKEFKLEKIYFGKRFGTRYFSANILNITFIIFQALRKEEKGWAPYLCLQEEMAVQKKTLVLATATSGCRKLSESMQLIIVGTFHGMRKAVQV